MKTRLLSWLAVLMYGLTSCSMYHPQAVDIPLLTEKGEFRADGTFSLAVTMLPQTPGANTTISYAATDWLAVQAFADFDCERSYYFQGSVGAFKPLGKTVLEGFVGIGRGYGFHEYEYSTQNRLNQIYGHYNIYYGQVDFGWVNLTRVHLDVGGALKVGAFCPDFTDIDFDTRDGSVNSLVFYNNPMLLVEPQFFIRLGGESVKFGLKLGLTSLRAGKTDSGATSGFQYEPLDFGIGINYRF